MSESCGTCAFRQGCVTHGEVYNRLRSEVCALGGVPFYCHKTIDWKKGVDVISLKGKFIRVDGNPIEGEMPICDGWKDRVRELKAEGHYDNPDIRDIRRIAAKSILVDIEKLTISYGASEEEKTEAKERMHQMMPLLRPESKDDAQEAG